MRLSTSGASSLRTIMSRATNTRHARWNFCSSVMLASLPERMAGVAAHLWRERAETKSRARHGAGLCRTCSSRLRPGSRRWCRLVAAAEQSGLGISHHGGIVEIAQGRPRTRQLMGSLPVFEASARSGAAGAFGSAVPQSSETPSKRGLPKLGQDRPAATTAGRT